MEPYSSLLLAQTAIEFTTTGNPMTQIQLSQKWINRLVNQPETGMGFQIVTVTTANGNQYSAIVLNSEVLQFEDELLIKESEITDIVVTH